MKQIPVCYLADDLIGNELFSTVQAEIKGKYVAARPLNYLGGIFYRLELAIGVFRGKYDALRWYGQ